MPSNGNQPYSAKAPRSLPTTGSDLQTLLSAWQNQLAAGVQNAAPQVTPSNFSVTNSRGGLSLSWSPVQTANGADGYEILKSASGTFTDDLQVIPVTNVKQSSFFDSTGGNAQAASYRIRTTSGTAQRPQSQRGPESGPVRHTSIDATDVLSVPITKFDNATTDATRSLARKGNYGAFRQSGLGKSGGSGAGTGSGVSTGGTASSGGSGGGTQINVLASDFSGITTGENTSAIMIVGAGAQIIQDSTNPGVIDANSIQGIPVSSTAPTDGQLVQYSAANGQFQPAAIIGVGPQASLWSALPLGLGEIYVASDTGLLFIGTPGVGVGYLQVGDTSAVNETLLQILMELRAMRLATTSLACQGGGANPRDFDPQALASDAEAADMAQI